MPTERPKVHRRRIPAWFALLVTATVLANAVYNIVRVHSSYRVLELGGDATAVGFIAASFALAPLLVALPVGRAVDRNHARTAVITGSILTVAGAGLAAGSPTVWLLGTANVILGLGQLLFTAAGQGMVAQRADTADLDRRFGGLTLGVSLGQALGLPLGGVVTAWAARGGSTVDTTPSLLTAAVLGLLAVPLACALRMPRADTVPTGVRQSGMAMLRTPGMKQAMYSSLAVLSSMDILTAYLPVLGERSGIGVGTVTALLTARTLASMLSRLLLSHLVRWVDRQVLLVMATLCSAIPIALIPIVPVPSALLMFMLVAGFFMGVGQPLTMTWVVRLVSSHDRAAALSLRLSGNRLGQVVVPYLAGALAGATGVGAVFGLTGALLGAAAAFTARAPAPAPDVPARCRTS